MHFDENYEFAILADEILSFCALKGKNKSLLKKSQEKIFQIENLHDYGSIKVIEPGNGYIEADTVVIGRKDLIFLA